MRTLLSFIKNSLPVSMLMFSATAFAQTPSVQQGPSVLSNPVFISLAIIILLLFVVIVVLGDVLKGSARFFSDKQNNNKALTIAALFFAGTSVANAQTSSPDYFAQMNSTLFYVMVFIIVFELIIIGMLINSIKVLLGMEEQKAAEIAARPEQTTEVDVLLDKLNASVAIEEEGTIMFDHEYDGIRELDNNLPPWWKYGFYFTIVWSFGYLIYFHMSGSGYSSDDEYNREVKQAEIKMEEYLKKSANLVDESNVTFLSDASSLEKGKEIYMDNCAACHGKLGEGTVGPNLTDDYWIHGGSMKDIFKTVKYGYSDKGMKSWKDDLSPSQMAAVSSYVKNMKGTNPPNAKEKQGDFYSEAPLEPVAEAPADTSATK